MKSFIRAPEIATAEVMSMTDRVDTYTGEHWIPGTVGRQVYPCCSLYFLQLHAKLWASKPILVVRQSACVGSSDACAKSVGPSNEVRRKRPFYHWTSTTIWYLCYTSIYCKLKMSRKHPVVSCAMSLERPPALSWTALRERCVFHTGPFPSQNCVKAAA